MFAYAIPPIDFGWEFCPTASEYAALIGRSEFENRELGGGGEFNKFIRAFDKAKKLASERGWEGDFRDDPRVFQVPIEGRFVCAFAWKQENNGDTFVVAPVMLQHLKELDHF